MPGPRIVGLRAGLLLLVMLPAVAAAGEEEGGLFRWHPSLEVTTVASDNVFHEDEGAEGRIGAWIAPRVELAYQRQALELGADLGVDLRRWFDESSLDAELYRATGWGEARLGRGLSLRLENAWLPRTLRVGLPEDEASNLVQTNRSAVDLRWWRGLPGGRELEIGVEGSYFLSEASDEPVPTPGGGVAIDRDFRADHAQGLGFVELQAPVAEATRVHARLQGSYRDFRQRSEADHGNLSLLFGLRSKRWEGLELEVAGGVGALGFERFADELRALGLARLRYRLPPAWTLSLAARHLDSPNLAGEPALESTGELDLARRFGSATEAGLRLFVTRFEGDLRAHGANLFGGAELRLRHQVNRFLQLRVAYRHWRNAGSFDLDDFSQNRLSFRIALRR